MDFEPTDWLSTEAGILPEAWLAALIPGQQQESQQQWGPATKRPHITERRDKHRQAQAHHSEQLRGAHERVFKDTQGGSYDSEQIERQHQGPRAQRQHEYVTRREGNHMAREASYPQADWHDQHTRVSSTRTHTGAPTHDSTLHHGVPCIFLPPVGGTYGTKSQHNSPLLTGPPQRSTAGDFFPAPATHQTYTRTESGPDLRRLTHPPSLTQRLSSPSLSTFSLRSPLSDAYDSSSSTGVQTAPQRHSFSEWTDTTARPSHRPSRNSQDSLAELTSATSAMLSYSEQQKTHTQQSAQPPQHTHQRRRDEFRQEVAETVKREVGEQEEGGKAPPVPKLSHTKRRRTSESSDGGPRGQRAPRRTSSEPRSCSNCHVTHTPIWRRGRQGEILCNACGTYLRTHQVMRPLRQAEDPNAPGPRCSNCSTASTCLWRHDQNGNRLCNACGLYLRLHKKNRPVDMLRARPLVCKRKRGKGHKKKKGNEGEESGNTTGDDDDESVVVKRESDVS